jgi:N-hydroxyarylamine O-acetyltransferase
MVDLDSYFSRIGYTGSRQPNLQTLQGLHLLHPAAIAFEAIDVLLGRAIDLSPEAVDDKLIRRRRGGYCFEQNTLFKRVLTSLGFEVEGLAARVVWMAQPNEPPQHRTHMVLRVTLDGKPWLADVGFGSAVLTGPIRMDVDEPQTTPHERYKLTHSGGELLLETELDEIWAPVYRISPEPQLDSDYELPNWYTSTHPQSRFRNVFVVARSTPQQRAGLLENRITIRPRQGEVRREFLDAGQLEQVLKEIFGLAVEPEWRPILEQAVVRGEAAAEKMSQKAS